MPEGYCLAERLRVRMEDRTEVKAREDFNRPNGSAAGGGREYMRARLASQLGSFVRHPKRAHLDPRRVSVPRRDHSWYI